MWRELTLLGLSEVYSMRLEQLERSDESRISSNEHTCERWDEMHKCVGDNKHQRCDEMLREWTLLEMSEHYEKVKYVL